MEFQGVVFDVDGVLVDSPHEQAWRDGLRQLMEHEWRDIRPETSYAPEKFTSEVYRAVMSGKPRYAGARDALEYFAVPDAERRAIEYGDNKHRMIVELIEDGEFHAYPDALRFVLAVKHAGLRVAAASSSKNANDILVRVHLDTFIEREGLSYDFIHPDSTLLDILDANVSGREFEQGKPHPEIFLTASEEAGVSTDTCFVVEDAPNGVRAAKAGAMRALGLARADDADLLAEAGADLVVTTLDDVDLDGFAEGLLRRRDRG